MASIGNIFIQSINAEINRLNFRQTIQKTLSAPFFQSNNINSKISESKDFVNNIVCDQSFCDDKDIVGK